MRRRSREEAPWSAAAAACTARRMSFRLRLLLLLAWPNRRQADATDGADGDADLRCSACDMFVTQYLARCYATVFAKDATAVASVYRVRVAEVYKQHAPDRLYLVDGLLTKARGQEHKLYRKVCARYGAPQEPEYDGTEDGLSHEEVKTLLAAWAQVEVVDALRNSTTQLAVTGTEGGRKYVDFERAMSGGDTGSISTGGHIKDELTRYFEAIVSGHSDALAAAAARVSRPYDSQLHKTFCISAGMCARAAAGAEGRGAGDREGEGEGEREEEEEEEEEEVSEESLEDADDTAARAGHDEL